MKEFGAEDKRDKLNDEAIELVEAYLNQEWFTFDVIKNLNNAAGNVANWIDCMRKFRGAYKMVAPLIQKVNEMDDKLKVELGKLAAKESELKQVQDDVARKQAELDKIQAEADAQKETLEEFVRKL